ncbi:hypothetical protein K438DRAFT_1782136 [Mycena galopus ATCC 62051]|nr:hypothetical protein K438DRAFT_1782136 [Mycena galopus ATCC 62051]
MPRTTVSQAPCLMQRMLCVELRSALSSNATPRRGCAPVPRNSVNTSDGGAAARRRECRENTQKRTCPPLTHAREYECLDVGKSACVRGQVLPSRKIQKSPSTWKLNGGEASTENAKWAAGSFEINISERRMEEEWGWKKEWKRRDMGGTKDKDGRKRAGIDMGTSIS